MLILGRGKLTKPAGMSNKEFYGIWQKESEAALAAINAGIIQVAYKVAGKPEVYAVIEAETADDLDHVVHSLPIWKLGYSHVVTELEWIPLRHYTHWAAEADLLTHGRLECGLGRGHAWLFPPASMPLVESRPRYE